MLALCALPSMRYKLVQRAVVWQFGEGDDGRGRHHGDMRRHETYVLFYLLGGHAFRPLLHVRLAFVILADCSIPGRSVWDLKEHDTARVGRCVATIGSAVGELLRWRGRRCELRRRT